jgi:hypothetical protein
MLIRRGFSETWIHSLRQLIKLYTMHKRLDGAKKKKYVGFRFPDPT